MKNEWVIIKQLDRQFKEWQIVNAKYKRPRAGWVKTIRVALNMTTQQLANRIGVKGGRISQLEKAEMEDAVTLRALREVAEALNCDLVYALVPKNGLTLENIVKGRARQVAEAKIKTIAHSMSLEAQTLSKEAINEQKDELAKQLTEYLHKNLWANESQPNKKRVTGKLSENHELLQGIARVMEQEHQSKKKRTTGKVAENLKDYLSSVDAKGKLK